MLYTVQAFQTLQIEPRCEIYSPNCPASDHFYMFIARTDRQLPPICWGSIKNLSSFISSKSSFPLAAKLSLVSFRNMYKLLVFDIPTNDFQQSCHDNLYWFRLCEYYNPERLPDAWNRLFKLSRFVNYFRLAIIQQAPGYE